MPGNIVETQPAATETQPASALADTRPSIEGTFQSFDALLVLREGGLRQAT